MQQQEGKRVGAKRKRQEVVVYCDGACWANGDAKKARASIGVYFAPNDPRNISAKLPPAMPQTNQCAELWAAINTLRAVPVDQPLLIKSDSIYTIKAATEWRKRWIARGWSPSLKLKNVDLFRQLSDLVDARKAPLQWEHVRGHSGNEGNDAADLLATQALACDDPQKFLPVLSLK
jgi:ribonuclease HI